MIDVASAIDNDEGICHYNAVRIRVVGSGVLQMAFFSLDNAINEVIAPVIMSNTSGIEPRSLANFITQRAFLELKTTEIDEIFNVNRIVVFAKPLWSEYPG